MSRIIIKPIPRKKFDARVNRNMVKGSLPNHYPNTRVGLLENRVKTLEDNPPPTITLDDTVTEGSPNGVKSSGIWAALLALLQSFQNLLGLHVNADNNAHPASAITVDETPVADYTQAEQGNNLQQVTNKVAGLQKKLIYSDTLTVNSNPVEITQDNDGNPLALTDFYLYIYHPSYSSSTMLLLTVNDIDIGYDFRNAINSNAITLYQGNPLVYSIHFVKFKLTNIITGVSESFYRTDSSLLNFYSQFAIPAVTEINKITITAKGVRKLPAGTKIEIYRL